MIFKFIPTYPLIHTDIDVYNIKDLPPGWNSDDNFTYIGRPSIWGNPFALKDHSRDEAVAKYEHYLVANEHLINKLSSLKSKRLVCFCSPLKCHGDILIKLVNNMN